MYTSYQAKAVRRTQARARFQRWRAGGMAKTALSLKLATRRVALVPRVRKAKRVAKHACLRRANFGCTGVVSVIKGTTGTKTLCTRTCRGGGSCPVFCKVSKQHKIGSKPYLTAILQVGGFHPLDKFEWANAWLSRPFDVPESPPQTVGKRARNFRIKCDLGEEECPLFKGQGIACRGGLYLCFNS